MKLFVPIVVGAVIGYITNWLAIKMLFRPYKKIEIFGFTLPFTPGLIPKEKARIAKSVGDAVGQHILSPDVIAVALSSERTNQQVNTWIKDKYYSLKTKDESINELLDSELKKEVVDIIKLLSDSLADFIIQEFRNPDIKKGVIKYIDLNFYNELKNTIEENLLNNANTYITNLIQSEKANLFISKIIETKLSELTSESRSLDKLIDEDIIDSLKELVNTNKKLLGNGVKEIYNDPDVKNRLNKSVSTMVEQNLNRFITMFISPDQISEKILQVVDKYINDTKSYDDYAMLLNSGLDKLLALKVSDLMIEIEPLVSHKSTRLSAMLQDGVTSKNIEGLIAIIKNEVEDSEAKINEYVLNSISDLMDKVILSETFEKEIKKFIQKSITDLLNKPISTILEGVDNYTVDNFVSLFRKGFDTFAEHELLQVIEYFNVSEIVENQINSFDVEYTEELILEIANKELKAITWLGALLGGLMGILTPILQMI